MMRAEFNRFSDTYRISGVGVIGVDVPDGYWNTPAFSTLPGGSVAHALNAEYGKFEASYDGSSNDYDRLQNANLDWFTGTKYLSSHSVRISWFDIPDGLSASKYWHFCWRLYGSYFNAMERFIQKIQREHERNNTEYILDSMYTHQVVFDDDAFYFAMIAYAHRNNWSHDDIEHVMSSWYNSAQKPRLNGQMPEACPFLNRRDQLHWLERIIRVHGRFEYWFEAGKLLARHPDLVSDTVVLYRDWVQRFSDVAPIYARDTLMLLNSSEWEKERAVIFDTRSFDTTWDKTCMVLGIEKKKTTTYGEFNYSTTPPTHFHELLFHLGYALEVGRKDVTTNISMCLLEHVLERNREERTYQHILSNSTLAERDPFFGFLQQHFPDAFRFLHSDRGVDMFMKSLLNLESSIGKPYPYCRYTSDLRYLHMVATNAISNVDSRRIMMRLMHRLQLRYRSAPTPSQYTLQHHPRRIAGELLVMHYFHREQQTLPSMRQLQSWIEHVLLCVEHDRNHPNSSTHTLRKLQYCHASPILFHNRLSSLVSDELFSDSVGDEILNYPHSEGNGVIDFLIQYYPDNQEYRFIQSLQLDLYNTLVMVNNALLHELSGDSVNHRVAVTSENALDLDDIL